MQVFVNFFLLFWLGVMTYQTIAEIDGRKSPGLTRSKSAVDRFRALLGSLRSLSRRGSRKNWGDDVIATPDDASCTHRLEAALQKMNLEEVINVPFNKDHAKRLEDQILEYIENVSGSYDITMKMTDFWEASGNVRMKPTIPKLDWPKEFDLEIPAPSGEENMSLQKRCSKRCLWLYGYTILPVIKTAEEAYTPTHSGKWSLTPIVVGIHKTDFMGLASNSFKSRNAHGGRRCSCSPTREFLNASRGTGFSVTRFQEYQKESSNKAVKYLAEFLGRSTNRMELMEHENFMELVAFDILRNFRPRNSPADILSEARSGVLGANEEYRKFMGSGTPPRSPSFRSFRRKKSKQ